MYPVFFSRDGHSIWVNCVKGILLDENVPCRLRFPLSLPIIHSTELGPSLTDSQLWTYARAHQLVILTKDVDFSKRMMSVQSPPWVVHLQIGNVRAGEFHRLLEELWPQIVGSPFSTMAFF